MSLLKAALGALGYVGSTYVNDAVVKPRRVGKLARSYCDRVRKPLLLVHASRMTDLLFGEPVKADVTTSRAYPLPYRDRTFGAVVVVNVLEGLRRPDVALMEWRRVADKVFVVIPSWWSPQAWLDPSNRWLVDPTLKRVVPLWTRHRRVYLLPVSDSRYGRRPWKRTRSTSPATTQLHPSPTPPPSPSPSAPSPDTTPDPPSWMEPETVEAMDRLPPSGSPRGEEMAAPYDESEPLFLSKEDLDPTSSEPLASTTESLRGASSNSPRVLTVVSQPASDGG